MKRAILLMIATILLLISCANHDEALRIALDDPRVKRETRDREYQIGEIRRIPNGRPVYEVPIYLGRRELPGVTIRAYVDMSQEKVRGALIYVLRPRQLREEEKARVRHIALSDPEVVGWLGGKEFAVTGVEEGIWTESRSGKETYYIYPKVTLSVPPDERVGGWFLHVFVDLKAGKVVRVSPYPRKPPPP